MGNRRTENDSAPLPREGQGRRNVGKSYSISSQATISIPLYITTSLWSFVVFTDSLTMSLSAYPPSLSNSEIGR